MDEAEWLSCADPDRLLGFVLQQTTDRKVRLFACACCRRFFDWLDLEHDQRAVQVGEMIADRQAIREEHGDAHIRGYDIDLAEEEAYFAAIGATCVAGVCAADRLHFGEPSSERWKSAEAEE